MGNYTVRLFADNLRHPVDGRLGGDDLGIVVPHAADIDKTVSVSGGQFRPVIDQILFLQGQFVSGSRVINTAGFAPDANVRILFADPVDKTVIVLTLFGPHPVLDIPEQEPERCLFLNGDGL